MEAGALTTDSSGNGKTLTNNNSVAEGTGKFTGGADNGTATTKYLGIAEDLGIAGNGDLSISLWLKLNEEIGTSGLWVLATHRSTSGADRYFQIQYQDFAGIHKVMVVPSSASSISAPVALGTSNWHHIVATRSATTGYSQLYLDGAYIGRVANGAITAGQNISYIGSDGSNGTKGIFDDTAFFNKVLSADEVKELYEGRFIGEFMPRATQGLDSYTKLLLHGNGADASTVIVDETAKAVTVVGNAQLDTAQQKFGSGSILFDGTGDYLTLVDSADWAFGTGDFTIDLWARWNNAATGDFCGQRVDANNEWWFYWNPNAIAFYQISGGVTNITFNNAFVPTVNTWYHIAVVRSGNTWRMFVNGVQIGTDHTEADSMADMASVLYIGTQWNGASVNAFNGWIDEFRISKGIARWTANFTPPDREYRGGTKALYHCNDGLLLGDASPNNYSLTFRSLDQNYITGQDADANFRYNTANSEEAQGFTPAVSGQVTHVSLYLKKVASPTGNMYVQIQTNNAGVPSNTSLAQSNNLDVATLTTGYAWYTFTFATPTYVTAGTVYHIVCFASTTISTTNYIRIGYDASSSAYAGGQYCYRYNAAWTANATNDLLFQVFMDNAVYDNGSIGKGFKCVNTISQFSWIANANCADLNFVGSRTIGCWYTPTSLLGTGERLIAKDDDSAGYALFVAAGGQESFYVRGLNSIQVTGSTAMSAGNRYFIMGVYDRANGELRVYRNGARTAVVTGITGIPTNIAKDFCIGSYASTNGVPAAGAVPCNGIIDEAILEDTAWSDDEVADYYRYAKGRY